MAMKNTTINYAFKNTRIDGTEELDQFRIVAIVDKDGARCVCEHLLKNSDGDLVWQRGLAVTFEHVVARGLAALGDGRTVELGTIFDQGSQTFIPPAPIHGQ